MRVLTAGDSSYYHCLEGLANSVYKHYGQRLIIYDLGLTEAQKKALNAEVVSIPIHVDYGSYITYKHAAFIKTTHKPFCIKHYFEHTSEPVIYADADCLFLEPVELDGFDIGVTVKPRKTLDRANYCNGILNAGVIIFHRYPEPFAERWIRGCLRPDTTDQMVLAELLSETIDWKHYNHVYDWHGLKIKTFRIEDYNDYYLKTGKIYHFKGDRHGTAVYREILNAIETGEDAHAIYKRNFKKGLIRRFLRKL